MTSNTHLCSLQFAYESRSLPDNFETLASLIAQCQKKSLILAPELCLSGYRYEAMHEAATFSTSIMPQLRELSTCKTFGLSLITHKNENFFNTFMLFHHGDCVYTQNKAKLFALGDEDKHFSSGDCDAIRVFEIEGIKIAVLICFELRFNTLWEQIKGADVILVPAFWGGARKVHLEALTQALAIMNQAYVVCANSADDGMARGSGIITPLGAVNRNDESALITQLFDAKEIKTMRRYIDIGLHTHASHGSL